MHRPTLSHRALWALLAVLTAMVVLVSATAFASRSAPAAKAPSAASGASAAAAAQPAGGPNLQCRLNEGPAEPLELNLVASGGLFKAIAMEKEIFTCQAGAGGAPNQIRDVETFIEIVEQRNGRLNPNGIVTEINTCIKALPVGTVRCRQAPLPLSPPNPNPLEGCDIASHAFPADPVEMSSATISNFVKTIKVEKEWFKCPDGIRDVYLFTEMVEQRIDAAAGSTFNTIKRTTIGVVCLKNEQQAAIKTCSRFPTS